MKIEKKIKGMPPQWRHKIHYGESLAQMGKRLGISREAVRLRIKRWGSPEHSARPIYHKGETIYHKGETLEQMSQRLGISREAVRLRIKRWGSPEHSARPIYHKGQRTNATPTISARMLRVWGYDSITQLAQQPDSELLRLWSFGHRRLARLRQLYPIENKAEAVCQVDTNTDVL